MSRAVKIFQGRFGHVALLDMNASLVAHAHHYCHILIKAGGSDSAFSVRGHRQPLTDESAVLINAWEPHALGFSASGHFARFFRQHLGITPTDHRRVVNLYEPPASDTPTIPLM